MICSAQNLCCKHKYKLTNQEERLNVNEAGFNTKRAVLEYLTNIYHFMLYLVSTMRSCM